MDRRALQRNFGIDTTVIECGSKGIETGRIITCNLAEFATPHSYTHRGAYYTLTDIPDFDEYGFWFHQSVGF